MDSNPILDNGEIHIAYSSAIELATPKPYF